jgi:polyisoprenoid-binding protein YceI
MKQIFYIIAIALVANLAQAQVKHTVTKSNITFSIKNMGFNTGGFIGTMQADINFSKDRPETSNIIATADAASINTDNDSRDEHLKSADFFDVVKYPKITLKSASIKHKSGNNYLGNFNVTIKDKTNLVAVPFTYIVNGSTAQFKGSFKIKRADYGIGTSTLTLSDEVTINLEVSTTQ